MNYQERIDKAEAEGLVLKDAIVYIQHDLECRYGQAEENQPEDCTCAPVITAQLFDEEGRTLNQVTIP